MQGWSRPNLQHDASEFLLRLMRSGHEGSGCSKWLLVTRRGHQLEVEEHGSGIIHMTLPSTEDGIILNAVVQAWHRQRSQIWDCFDSSRCLQRNETHVAIALKRFGMTEIGCQKYISRHA